MKAFFLCLFVIGFFNLEAQNAGLETAFVINEEDVIPEGIAYDSVKDDFYLSSTYKRKIIKIESDGSYSDFINSEQYGIKGVLGIKVDPKRRIIWAISSDIGKYMPIINSDSTELGISYLHRFDIDSKQLLKKYILRQENKNFFLNDLSLDENGIPFITETIGQSIYTINPVTDSITLFYQLPKAHYPNGIDINLKNNTAFIALYTDSLPTYGRLNLKTKEFQLISMAEGITAGADGLYYYKNTLIGILPNENGDRIIKYILNETENIITEQHNLINKNTALSQPTTGVMAHEAFYFITNSYLQKFAASYNHLKRNSDKVIIREPVIIGKIKLE